MPVNLILAPLSGAVRELSSAGQATTARRPFPLRHGNGNRHGVHDGYAVTLTFIGGIPILLGGYVFLMLLAGRAGTSSAEARRESPDLALANAAGPSLA